MRESQPDSSGPAPSAWHNQRLWVLGQGVTLLAEADRTTGAFCLIEVEAPPGVPGPPPHLHRDCAESFHMLEGELEVLVGENWERLTVGQSMIVPSGTLHTFRNPGQRMARFLSVFAPGGFDRFFHDFGSPRNAGDAAGPAPTAQVIARLIGSSESYGMVIPPPSK